MAIVLDGTALISVDGQANHQQTGKIIVMPANAASAIFAAEQFKMLLTVLFGDAV